jgi:hypothetical protein
MLSRRLLRLALLVAVAAAYQSPVGAETAAKTVVAPGAYRVTVTNAVFGPPETVITWRSGSRALIERVSANPADRAAVRTRTLYDLEAHKSFSWSVANNAVCSVASFSGDWGDPFGGAAELIGPDARLTGIETIGDRSANVYDAPAPGSDSLKAWIDNKTGLILKAQLVPQTGDPRTIIEVTDISLAEPAASTFAVPAGCTAAAEAMTPEQQLAVLVGGNPQDYVDATHGPASTTSCAASFHIVRAGTMTPITKGFQLGLDAAVNVAHPATYTIGMTPEGEVEFKGGGLHEVTSELRDGALRIENPPVQFELDAEFGNSGAGHALLYRQCFGPQTTLLFVVKNPARLSDGGVWLWVKSGKYAGPR